MKCTKCGRELPEGPPCLDCLETFEDVVEDSRASVLAPREQRIVHRSESPKVERFLPGNLFAGRYRIVHQLGVGGMGEVYRAEDIRLEQTIAVKFLFESSQNHPRALMRFRDEARLARQVSHSGVCRIFDFGEAEGLAYVVMEHIEGENLASLRRRVGRPSPERALEIALEICDGLGAIHEQGILHRDLKPANVMLDDKGRTRILDFGLAAMADAVTGADLRSGTPAYMAPEQAAGREVTVRSDLYSLGLVLWELWTGDRLRGRDRQEPPEISARVAGVAPAIDRMVARCLAFEPERRPASAESVAAGLKQSVDHKTGPVLRTVVVCEPPMPSSDRDEMISDLLASFGGQEIWDIQGCLWLFERPWDAASCAVAWRARSARDKRPDGLRMALEVAEVELCVRHPGELGAGDLSLKGDAAPLARALVALAQPGQTLLSAHASHLARRGGRAVEGGECLSWLCHGRYRLPGSDEPVEVFEVGVAGQAPLKAPESTEFAVLALDTGMVPGWRPAPGAGVPQRPNFCIERQLGEGGFGEVWLVRHRKTGERRVFKFCFDASRLRGLRREITLFRLLKEELGDRKDIARVLDWNLEEAPFFIESEYTAGGDLVEWVEEQGGLDKIPLTERLELVAQVADALAAAHSVGVLHKDVKPANILITTELDGGFKARLADFGIGLATDIERLVAAGITIAGMTVPAEEESGDSASGTRLYMAPEVLEGRSPTLQADIYALGVVLYQLVVGHLGRAVAPGWRDRISDPLLVEDLAAALHGNPADRFQSARELAVRLRSLDTRRIEAQETAAKRREEEDRRRLLEQTARRRRRYRLGLAFSLAMVAVMALLTGWALAERKKEAAARRESERMVAFLFDLFDVVNPVSSALQEGAIHEFSVVDLLEGGMTHIESTFEKEPHIQARLLTKLGTVLGNVGRHKEAQEMLERSLDIRLEISGDDHLEVAESLDALGDLDAASTPRATESLLRRALEIRRHHLPADHADLAASLSKLAWNLYNQGRYVEAEVLSRESLAMRRRLHREEHLDIARSLGQVALVLYGQGSYVEAETLHRESAAMYRNLLGDEHPELATSLGTLATTLSAQGIYVEAEALQRKSLKIFRSVYGEEHQVVGTTLYNLAQTLHLQGFHPEAEIFYREAFETKHRVLGKEHPYVGIALSGLASVLVERGELKEAEQRIQEALATLRNAYAPGHWRISVAESVEAAIWIAEGQYEPAETALLASHANLLKLRGPQAVPTRRTQKRLIALYEAWGKLVKAQKYRAPWIEAGGALESVAPQGEKTRQGLHSELRWRAGVGYGGVEGGAL